jgi:Ca-activated chloride channel family protein
VGFGKDAFLFFPLTLDYGVMLRVLQGLKLGDIDGSGTAIGNALAMSLSRLKESEAKTRVVILITDGEDNGSNVSPMELAREAARQDIKVFTILVGSEGDQRQPTDMVDFATGKRLYQKVAQPVNPKLLSDIAEATRASFYRATDPDSLERDFQTILDTFEKTRLVDYAAAERTELFNRFLLPAIALILLEILLSQTLLRRFP